MICCFINSLLYNLILNNKLIDDSNIFLDEFIWRYMKSQSIKKNRLIYGVTFLFGGTICCFLSFPQSSAA